MTEHYRLVTKEPVKRSWLDLRKEIMKYIEDFAPAEIVDCVSKWLGAEMLAAVEKGEVAPRRFMLGWSLDDLRIEYMRDDEEMAGRLILAMAGLDGDWQVEAWRISLQN